MNNKVNKNGAVSLTKKDREELLRLINIFSGTLEKVKETYDLELSDLRNMYTLQWELFKKLELTHNAVYEDRYSNTYVLKEGV